MKHREIKLSDSSDDNCNAIGCDKSFERSVSRKKVDKIDSLNVEGKGRKVGLCQDCYRIYKKATKKDRTMESLGR
ncbi:uncharacterized protein METZ01_LOCUS314269 [marine metagenome]|uniref:Uncharacterized protein n=1 Tax=marine metagenome TaxID=408172 RepID=A0A382NM88_9ZZZZ|tara:strand:- start:2840 stop:3064 length:225 start_codon:yes stop_codon:yes gene_type:complete